MTSISPSAQPHSKDAGSKISTLDNTLPAFIKLGKIERLVNLKKIITTLVLKIFTFGIFQGEIRKWWDEFKTGKREIKPIVLNPQQKPAVGDSSINPADKVDALRDQNLNLKSPKSPANTGSNNTGSTSSTNSDDFQPESPSFRRKINTTSPESPKSGSPSNKDGSPSNKSESPSNHDLLKDSTLDTIGVDVDSPGEQNKGTSEIDSTAALKHPHIARWLEASEENAVISQMDFFKTIKELHDAITNGKEKTQAEETELEKKFLQFKDKIVAIHQSSPAHFSKITEYETNQFAYRLLKNQFSVISLEVNKLDDCECGTFKANMLELLQLVSQSSNNGSLEGSTINVSDQENAFDDFQDLLNELKNAKAKNAFILFTELLQSEIRVTVQELEEYNQIEAAINKANKKLSEPLQNLADKTLSFSDKQLYLELKKMSEIFSVIPDFDDKPCLKQIFDHKNQADLVYQLLEERKDKISNNPDLLAQVLKAQKNMEHYLGTSSNEKLGFAIKLGKDALSNPSTAFNKYLVINGGLQYAVKPPANSLNIEEFFENMHEIVEDKTFSAEDLLALEAFTSMALYSYIINPETYLDSSFKSIADSINLLRAATQKKLNESSIQGEVETLRKKEKNQTFYKFLKDNVEQTPNYPKDFWKDSKAAAKLKSLSSLAALIGVKIADPTKSSEKHLQLIQKNESIGYEIYLHPGTDSEKPKLVFFVTKDPGYSMLQEMNHQLGLFGDPTYLKTAQEIVAHMTSTELLEGYLHDLVEGNIEIVGAGFGNSGAIATIVASRLAPLYPKTQVTSLAAGSATVVTTEDAYNINKHDNFLPIRLKYVSDNDVNRKLSGQIADFSEELYHTFPLLVRYNKNTADFYKHNPEEYGNIDNFVPAMRNPLILRKIYQELSSHIVNEFSSDDDDSQDNDVSMTISAFLDKTKRSRNCLNLLSSELQDAGRIADFIELGDEILKAKKDKDKFNGAFPNFGKKGLTLSRKTKQLAALENEKAVEQSWLSGVTRWIGDLGKTKANMPVKTSVLTIEEQDDTIDALKDTIVHLKNPDVIDLLTPQRAFSLLIAADTLLVNYTQINTNIGKLPQLVDHMSEIRLLASKRLLTLFKDKEHKNQVVKLFKNCAADLQHLAVKAVDLNPHYKCLFNDKDVLGKIDYEERFLEFIGFKIAVKNQDKIGSDSYVSKLHTDTKHHYDISLFTPDCLSKKQRIVICLNSEDALGNDNLSASLDFGAGDSAILNRAEDLNKIVLDQLKEQFKQHQFNEGDVEIVVTGFGSEGSVATALGYHLAKEFEKCQVQSLGFAAPRFTTKEGGDTIQKQKNFVPLRFLSPNDKTFEFKLPALGDIKLFDNSFYTIPFEFRIVAVTEKLEGQHARNLYGDIQGIKTSLKSAYLMRDIAKSSIRASKANKANLSSAALLPKRIIVDARKNVLSDLSQKTVAELSLVPPGKLIGIMKYCVELSESASVSEDDKNLIRNFFRTFIQAIKNDDINEKHTIENKFFKKMMNHGYKPEQLFGAKWKLQRIISCELENAMKAVKNADKKIDPKELEELLLTRSFYRGVLAADLNGNRYRPAGGGVNGAVFFRHLESGLKKAGALLLYETSHIPFLGVFKPHPHTVSEFKGWFDLTQMGERIKTVAGMDSHLNQDDSNKRVNNEIFAYEMFHIFGFKSYIGFPTTLKFINKNDQKGRPASFCAFVPGLDMVNSHVKSVSKKEALSNILDDDKRQYNQAELHIWQMSKIFDFLTGNMDGHEGNAFVKVENNKVTGAVNFDYDKAFAIEKTPQIANQYKWAKLEISKNNFTKATLTAMEELLKDGDQKIEAFLERTREENKLNFSQDQEKLLRERVEVLRRVVKGEISQLSDLAKFK